MQRGSWAQLVEDSGGVSAKSFRGLGALPYPSDAEKSRRRHGNREAWTCGSLRGCTDVENRDVAWLRPTRGHAIDMAWTCARWLLQDKHKCPAAQRKLLAQIISKHMPRHRWTLP